MEEITVSEPKQQSEISIAAKKITDGLVAFEKRKSELTELKKEADGLKIESLEDRETINMVSTVRKKLKSARVEIEKEGKSMRDPLTAINRNIAAKEKELIDIIEPTEKALLIQEKWVDAEKEKIRQADERKEQERVQSRIDRLAEYGYAIDLTLLKGIDDETFEKTVESARVEWQKEQDAIAEKERQDQEAREQAEKDRMELKALREKQEEADRILKERQDELNRQAIAVKKRQEEQDREAAFQKREAESRLRRDRVAQLNDIGGNGQEYFARYDDTVIVCEYDQLILLSDEEFAVIRDKHNAENAKVVERKRVEAEELAEKRRIERQVELDRLQKETIDKAIADEKERQRKAAEKEAEDRKQAELKKQQELVAAGDKAVWADFISKLKALPVPTMNSPQYRRMAAISRDKLLEVYNLKP